MLHLAGYMKSTDTLDKGWYPEHRTPQSPPPQLDTQCFKRLRAVPSDSLLGSHLQMKCELSTTVLVSGLLAAMLPAAVVMDSDSRTL